jgi:hypothetical protein
MYAVAPLPIAFTHIETYSVATPLTWQPVRIEGGVPVVYGGFEVEGEFTPDQVAEIESMGGQVLGPASAYHAWQNP